ncbi:AAA family ATPase [Roseibium sp. RKSG952]|uniref:AAA family ATPase n=1 Tax=Roseibium sp. RKSG952 TaxID=2529384 RepID=UPI0012BD29CB|nr:AAA family ATPase [Roseibium sp. RKSG952]
MKVDKIGISGFKSFADPVQLEIKKGMTGIVGPNGCGKSNVMDGFRWAMGEASPKKIRAGGMDDVIFGGTDARPPKSTCEVRIFLNNEARTAPVEFNDTDSLEVGRRLQRGDGSTYRVNGKTARARDVQTLFKDAGLGAAASAIVSQGKVGAIINAKPSERRSLLEEAAGVTGLSARRREAEIKLKATEQNLERAEDMGKGLSDQLTSLKRQARQAARYKTIDTQIRSAEAIAFLVRWKASDERLRFTQNRHKENEERAAGAILALKKTEEALAETELQAEPIMSGKREAETALALAEAAVDTFDKEIAAAQKALEAAKRNVSRTKVDLERTRQENADTAEEASGLKDEIEMLEEDELYGAKAISEATEEHERAHREALEAADTLRALEAGAAALRERQQALRRRHDDLKARLMQNEVRRDQMAERIASLKERIAGMTDGSDAILEMRERIEETSVRALELADLLPEKEQDVSRTNAVLSEKSAQAAALRAELEILVGLNSDAGEGFAKTLIVHEGYERALAAALGEGLNAGTDEASGRHWNGTRLDVKGPEWLPPLSRYVSGSELVLPALKAVGVAKDDHQATKHVRQLKQGMSIVTMDGRLYRWDGYCSDKEGAAEQDLKRSARIRALGEELPRIEVAVGTAQKARDEAAKTLSDTKEVYGSLREEEMRLRRQIAEMEKANAKAMTEKSEALSSLKAAEDILPSIIEELDVVRADLESAVVDMTEAMDAGTDVAALTEAKEKHAERVALESAARSRLDLVNRESDLRKTKLVDVRRRIAKADEKARTAAALIAELNERLQEYAEEVAACEESEALAPDAGQRLVDRLQEAREEFAATSESASAIEKEIVDGRDEVRKRTEEVSVVREDRAAILAELKAGTEALEELNREIRERLNCETAELPGIAGVDVDAELPEVEACDARVARLVRERDNIGTVNLLAEEQASEIEEKLGGAKQAVTELREAVSLIRKLIGDLDTEARARLIESFALMDGNFKELFTRVFEGGEAHLKLSGSEDILEAGLEIYASPPGKKMQTMSLMSGGEQAMAAIALIFAAFLIRPAPVCVLDEVDAPLDDANVDRLCRLVKEMALDDSTRFLVVTHHPLTMANCDRLYGVTMAERGVSRIASIDVNEAVEFGHRQVNAFPASRDRDF